MKVAFVTCGLPGFGYHGGAVTCWAIIKALRSRGHQVAVLSLFDTSMTNPYLQSKHFQIEQLHKLGVSVELLEQNQRRLGGNSQPPALLSALRRGAKTLINPSIDTVFLWSKVASQAQRKLEMLKPDVVFCYHFDALSAIYAANVAPIIAGVGDLWHLPGIFRWKMESPSLKKYFFEGPYRLSMAIIAKRCMVEMLQLCCKKGAFAAHYAQWLRRQKGLSDTQYFRTPVHDPVGEQWRALKDQNVNSKRPKILMIGDITGTAARSALKFLKREILPALEKQYGLYGFEIHIVGGGGLDMDLRPLQEKPYIKIKGRIIPPDQEFLSADVLFVPTSITLGIRVKIITGFSYGSCIVSHKANTAGIPELVHEYNGLVAEKGSDLAAELIRVLNNRQLRRILENNARKTFEEYFSEGIAAGRIVDEMENVGW